MTVFLETRSLPADIVAWLSSWMANDIPFDGISQDECAYSITVTFRNDFQMDINVMNGDGVEPSWIACNLYEPISIDGILDYRYVYCEDDERSQKLLDTFEIVYECNTYLVVLGLERENDQD